MRALAFVGLKVAALVRDRLEGVPGVNVEEEEAGGLRRMERMTGYDCAVLVDAAVTGGTPGTISRLTPDDLPTQRTAAAQDVARIELARRHFYEPALDRVVFLERPVGLEFLHGSLLGDAGRGANLGRNCAKGPAPTSA